VENIQGSVGSNEMKINHSNMHISIAASVDISIIFVSPTISLLGDLRLLKINAILVLDPERILIVEILIGVSKRFRSADAQVVDLVHGQRVRAAHAEGLG
jgi:hypothetical protein